VGDINGCFDGDGETLVRMAVLHLLWLSLALISLIVYWAEDELGMVNGVRVSSITEDIDVFF